MRVSRRCFEEGTDVQQGEHVRAANPKLVRRPTAATHSHAWWAFLVHGRAARPLTRALKAIFNYSFGGSFIDCFPFLENTVKGRFLAFD